MHEAELLDDRYGLKERLQVTEDVFNRSGVHESKQANIYALVIL